MEQAENGGGKSDRKASWFVRQHCLVQFILIFIPMACLLTAVIVLAILYDYEVRNREEKVPETSTVLPKTTTTLKTTILPQTTTTPPKTTTKASGPSVCSTEACVAAAGLMLATMDRKAKPCDDFYQYTCGGYEREQNIPSGYSKYTSFDKARNAVNKNLRDVLNMTAPPVEAEAKAKARRYFSACMKADTTKGPIALKEMVTDLGGFVLKSTDVLPNDWSLQKLIEKRYKYSPSGFFSLSVDEDNKNVVTSIIQLTQGGLGLGGGTRDYYIGKNVTDDPVLTSYVELLHSYAAIITNLEFEHALAVDVVRFEQKLAEIQLSNSAIRDPTTMYNKQDVTWLQAKVPFIEWLPLFRSIFTRLHPPITIADNEPVLLFGTSYLTNLTTLIEEYSKTPEGKRTLHNYAIFQAVLDYAPKFGGLFQAAYDKFQEIYAGKKGSLPVWQTCVTETDKTVGFGLGALYVDAYFSQASKDLAVAVIESVSAAFRQRVIDVDWMDKQTKAEALAKVDSLTYEAAYPDWIKDDSYLNKMYANLQVSDDFVDNQFKAYTYRIEDEFSRLRTGRDPKRWGMTPQTVNAYYSQTVNKFVVPAGILMPPFFQPNAEIPSAINYGAIGTVVGHEISHGFDDKGSQYDKTGNLANWWSDETLKTFQNKTQCLVDEYEKFEVDGLHLNGRMTLGENIGDNGGIRSSYQAYKTAIKPSEEHVFVGTNFTPDQLFFIGYAQVWCSVFTPQSLKQLILQDVHSPSPFRVKGVVVNSPDFAKAFSCPVGSPMNPVEKCTVW